MLYAIVIAVISVQCTVCVYATVYCIHPLYMSIEVLKKKKKATFTQLAAKTTDSEKMILIILYAPRKQVN